jgi:RNA polymerase subunit RPABC4/transcription elongation factor Spt4
MGLLAVFGIDNDAVNTAVNVLLLILVVLWVALVFWTYADARRRIEDPMLVACAAIAALFPFVGTIVYAIVRPPEFIEDVRLRELEMHAAEARLHNLDFEACPHCDYEVRSDYLRCPNCMRRLKEPCGSCGKPLEADWRVCPYCETEVPSSPAPQARRRRRSSTQETAAAE